MKSLLNIYMMAMFLCFSGAASGTAMAGTITLTDAKHAGLVGEREDGLIATVAPNPSSDVMELVNTTNAGRLDVYKETAAKQNIPLSDVRKIAAQKIFGMAASGDFLQVNGQWTRK